MAKTAGTKPVADHFPFMDDFIDSAGQTRHFQISLRKLPAGDFYIEANELSQRDGYRFDVYSAIYSDPAIGSALGKLRRKVRQRLATRYLHADRAGKKEMTHSELRGRISGDGVIVDGILLTFGELKTILTTHEGFEIRMVIGDSE